MQNKKVPKLRFPEFRDEWRIKKLGRLLSFKNGINASKEQYGKGKKFINVLDILNNDYIMHDKIVGKVDIDDKTFENSLVSYGDILFQRSSETREEVGTANVYLDKEKNATFGGFVIRGKKVGEYDPYFLNKLLKTPLARKEITTKAGGSTRYNVGQDTLSEVEVFLPKLNEQEKIAQLFTLIDKKIEKQSQKIEELKKYKKGMMQKIFSQEIRFKDDNGEEYPNWEEKRLDQIGKLISGVAFSEKYQGHLNLPIKVFKVSDMNITGNEKYMNSSNNTISVEIANLMKVNIIESPSIIFAKVGAAIFLERKRIVKSKFLIDNNMMCIAPNNKVTLEYMYLVLNTIKLSRYAQVGALPSYNSSDIANIKISIPSVQEQIKISELFNKVERILKKEEEKLELLNQWKKGLLQQMFI